MNDKNADNLIKQARAGDADADMVLREVAVELMGNEKLLPSKLNEYIMDTILSGANNIRRKPGKNAHSLETRDHVIVDAIDRIKRYGFLPTRLLFTR